MATYMSAGIDPKVYSILEHARVTDKRVRIWYGDVITGMDWMEEYEVLGNVGRSTGIQKAFLLIKTGRSLGGSAILTDCIVKITIDKRIVYQHPKYKQPAMFLIKPNTQTVFGMFDKWTVFINEKRHAHFNSEKQATNWIAFMKGERNSK